MHGHLLQLTGTYDFHSVLLDHLTPLIKDKSWPSSLVLLLRNITRLALPDSIHTLLEAGRSLQIHIGPS